MNLIATPLYIRRYRQHAGFFKENEAMLITSVTPHDRWITIAGRDIVPAVPDYKHQPNGTRIWFGDKPSTETTNGITRLKDWITRYADSEDLTDWLNAGFNLMLHHRRFKGLRFAPERLNDVSDALGVQQFPTILSSDHRWLTAVFTVPPMGYMRPAVAASGVEFLSEGSLTLCAGIDKQGRSPITEQYPALAMPPNVALYDLERFWRNECGLPLLNDIESLTGHFLATYGADQFLRRLHNDGWVKSYRADSVDVVCPFHPDALQLARYTPRAGKATGWFSCPYRECAHRKIEDYVAAVCG